MFHHTDPLILLEQDRDLGARSLEVDEEMKFKLRTAKLPLSLLSTLRPVLSGITNLEVTISRFLTNLNYAIDAIRPISNTLVNFILNGPVEYWPSLVIPTQSLPTIKQNVPLSFPALKYLKLSRISERNSRDMLLLFQCPALEEISVEETQDSEARHRSIYDSSLYVSVGFLHETLPSLKCLHIHTVRTQVHGKF